jgi:hypothetical protein
MVHEGGQRDMKWRGKASVQVAWITKAIYPASLTSFRKTVLQRRIAITIYNFINVTDKPISYKYNTFKVQNTFNFEVAGQKYKPRRPGVSKV